MGKPELKVFYISLDELKKLIHVYLKQHSRGHYTFDSIKRTEKQEQFQITQGTVSEPILLIAYFRNDGAISLSSKCGKVPYAGQKIVDGTYELYSKGHSFGTVPKKRTMSLDKVKFLFDRISASDGIEILKAEDTAEKLFRQYKTSLNEKITVSYWPSTGTIYSDVKTPNAQILVNDILSSLVDSSSSQDLESIIDSANLAEEEMISIQDEIIKSLGLEIYSYFENHNSALTKTLRSAYKNKRIKRTNAEEDYSDVVETISRTYEGLVQTLFEGAGLPASKLLNGYFYKNEEKNYFVLNNKYDKHLPNMSWLEKRKLGSLYALFSRQRNPVSHGNNESEHKIISSFDDAEKKFHIMENAAIECFNILKPYLKS